MDNKNSWVESTAFTESDLIPGVTKYKRYDVKWLCENTIQIINDDCEYMFYYKKHFVVEPIIYHK